MVALQQAHPGRAGAARVASTPGARAVLVEVPPGSRFRTCRPDGVPGVHESERRRVSDLSTKRNLGLLLARLNGWNKIAFLDDDITLRDPAAYPAARGSSNTAR